MNAPSENIFPNGFSLKKGLRLQVGWNAYLLYGFFNPLSRRVRISDLLRLAEQTFDKQRDLLQSAIVCIHGEDEIKEWIFTSFFDIESFISDHNLQNFRKLSIY